MATARVKRRDKQLEKLVEQNSRLHEDVEELETAYLLHRQTVEEDQNSVRGIIRREVGGSRWEHGGAGKLKTYKSSKDLKERTGNQTKVKSTEAGSERQNPRLNTDNTGSSSNKDGSKSVIKSGVTESLEYNEDTQIRNGDKVDLYSDQNRRVKLVKGNKSSKTDESLMEENGNQDRILDLKTKVLKKASSKIIKRDTWSGMNDSNSKINNTDVVIDNERKMSKVSNGNHVSTKSNKSAGLRRKNSLSKEKTEPAKLVNIVEDNTKKKTSDFSLDKKNKWDDEDSKKPSLSDNRKQVGRRSRLDLYENTDGKKSRSAAAAASESQNGVGKHGSSETSVSYDRKTNDDRNEDSNNVSKPIGVTYTPRKFEPLLVNGAGKPVGLTYTPRKFEPLLSENHKNDSRIFQTQPAEATEIFIDPEHFQVRVKSGNDDTFNDISELDGTKVYIQQVLHKSVEGSKKLPCTVVDDGSGDSPRNVRDIFGLGSFDPRIVSVASEVNFPQYGASASPFSAARHCNSEVEFWLRGLGLADVDKYVSIFAENEIDLLDLEFMSAAQLHDMGITALGALNKILKGVKDLKNIPKPENIQNLNKKQIQAASVAWEEVDERKIKKTFDVKSKDQASKTKSSDKSCHYETFTRKSSDVTNSDTGVVRCSSAMSNISDTGDSLLSSRGSNQGLNATFAASTKSSSAKCVDKRPPSAKLIVKTNTTNQSEGQLKRSNSNASDKPVSKLHNLKAKPTKSVLLRPRSSSVTREGSKAHGKKGKKGVEEKECKGASSRVRSRSVDTAKRKALEGVQAAAKKFEDKQQRTKDNVSTLNLKDDKKKLRRDEMAARHLQREKHKEVSTVHSSDSDDDVHNDDDGDEVGGLESLVTVNILSHHNTSARNDHKTSPTVIYVLPPINPQRSSRSQDERSKTRVVSSKPDVRKSLRRVEPAKKQPKASLRPVELHMEAELESPLLSTYKIKDGDHDKSQSEPESGYRTDGSTTYSQIEDRVTDIQLKIKRLKARATSGDEMTLTLVRDLQTQLQHFETQLSEKEKELRGQGRGQKGGDRPRDNGNRSAELAIRQSPRRSMSVDERAATPVNTVTISSTPRKSKTTPGDRREHSPIGTLLAEDGDLAPDKRENREKDGSELRMSKRELLDEMRKEKQQHHRQIRQLKCELQRFRHADPVSSLELDPKEITYTEQGIIGEGTFSQVYKGQYQGAEVAIKCLKIPLQTQDRNYFAAEVSLLKELRHPRVVLLIGVCTTTKLPLMVLEYMSHGSLFNHLHNPERECLDHALYYQIARDIALGMNYLHSHKPEVLHLDLKSMNILLCNSLRAKIADFGFSKLRHDAGQKNSGKAKNKPTPSAPFWMAPELLDKGEVTGKADVYSFGIILWEMLTRKVPYNSCSIFQVLEMVRKNRRPEIPSVTPEGLTHLIQQCWHANQARRPQFKDVIQILENLSFPPAWRELFQQAGVPDEALHNVQSTRTIISLVTSTLDSSDSNMMRSFMLPQNNTESQSRPTSSRETTLKESRSKSNSIERRSSAREINDADDRWESDTVSTLSERVSSDESEFTLKNMHETTTEDICTESSENDDDDSSVLTSDEDSTFNLPSSNRDTTARKAINANIPNLELSLRFARDEFKAERERINRTDDWLSISLDGSTNRSEAGKRQRTSQDMDMDINLHTLSNRSSACSTPSQQPLNDTVHANESARTKRRNKTKDLPLYSEEFLMRESFHNRRPPSPKKRISLSKKLLNQSNSGSVDMCDSARSDTTVSDNLETMSTTVSKSVPNVDSSYDSFFGIPVHRGPQISQNNKDENKLMKEDSLSGDSSYTTVVSNEYNIPDVTNILLNDKCDVTEEVNKGDASRNKNCKNVDNRPTNTEAQEETIVKHSTQIKNSPDQEFLEQSELNSRTNNVDYEVDKHDGEQVTGMASTAIKESDERYEIHNHKVNKTRSGQATCITDKDFDKRLEGPEQSNNEPSIEKTEEEQIRVKLNLHEVVEKKKPVITPRRSKMAVSDEKPTKEPVKNELQKEEKTRVAEKDGEVNPENRKTTKIQMSDSADIEGSCPSRESQTSTIKDRSSGNAKNTIRVKLRKDPLAPKLSAEPTSSVPPAPPPPPPPLSFSMSVLPCSKSVQENVSRTSMADELKSRLAGRQSLSEGMKIQSRSRNTCKPVKQENIIGLHSSNTSSMVSNVDKMEIPQPNRGEPRLVNITELDNGLVPQQSDGLPSFVLHSMDLQDQKDQLRSISRAHPDQLDDLSNASKEKLSSIAEILKKAVLGRRLAMREGTESVSQSLDSVATGWSVDTVT